MTNCQPLRQETSILDNPSSLTSSCSEWPVAADDLSREVYGILGVPVDLLTIPALLNCVQAAAANRSRLLLSTPNVNFLMLSHGNDHVRESLIQSDLCSADGMPLVWIARLLGIPLAGRVAGSDLFDALKLSRTPIRVFLFGGGEGVAASLGESLNTKGGALRCVGALNPGFGSVEDMSAPNIINTINASGADFLIVFLSAVKAQSWLLKNHASLQIPVRANVGATINFQIGKVRRSPKILSRMGLEWLWRIKEEPYLWRRYWQDGLGLIYLIVTCVIPLTFRTFLDLLTGSQHVHNFAINQRNLSGAVFVELSGRAVSRHVDRAINCFQNALSSGDMITIDLSGTTAVDQRFFGLFLMLRKTLASRGKYLNFVGASPKIKRLFCLNGFEYLLESR